MVGRSSPDDGGPHTTQTSAIVLHHNAAWRSNRSLISHNCTLTWSKRIFITFLHSKLLTHQPLWERNSAISPGRAAWLRSYDRSMLASVESAWMRPHRKLPAILDWQPHVGRTQIESHMRLPIKLPNIPGTFRTERSSTQRPCKLERDQANCTFDQSAFASSAREAENLRLPLERRRGCVKEAEVLSFNYGKWKGNWVKFGNRTLWAIHPKLLARITQEWTSITKHSSPPSDPMVDRLDSAWITVSLLTLNHQESFLWL